VASAESFLVEGLIEHCATHNVPLHFLSWHLYSDSPARMRTTLRSSVHGLQSFRR
jgi:hypothetical protein